MRKAYASNVDSNQARIVDLYRQVGATVQVSSGMGDGFPATVVGYCGRTYLVEIKNPEQSPAHRELTPAQQIWHDGWKGHHAIVETEEQALAVLGLRFKHT